MAKHLFREGIECRGHQTCSAVGVLAPAAARDEAEALPQPGHDVSARSTRGESVDVFGDRGKAEHAWTALTCALPGHP